MRIEERKSKKAKKGVTYRVKVDYVDEYGIKCTYSKSGFSSKAKAREHGTEMEYKLKNGLIKKKAPRRLESAFLRSWSLKKTSWHAIRSYRISRNIHIILCLLGLLPCLFPRLIIACCKNFSMNRIAHLRSTYKKRSSKKRSSMRSVSVS